jgi:hypothetical protein
MLESHSRGWLVAASVILLSACTGGEQGTQTAAQNPCAANPCAANPCAANPCAANPCAVGELAMKVTQGDRELNGGGNTAEQLIAMGEELFNDVALSGAGATACSTCHTGGYGMMNAGFAEPYPHKVEMAEQRAGLSEVTAAEMVQLCMVIPMANEPLDWNSVELASLTEYVTSLQEGFDPSMAGMNPCNPCAGNPCAGGNPCNPCAGGGGN